MLAAQLLHRSPLQYWSSAQTAATSKEQVLILRHGLNAGNQHAHALAGVGQADHTPKLVLHCHRARVHKGATDDHGPQLLQQGHQQQHERWGPAWALRPNITEAPRVLHMLYLGVQIACSITLQYDCAGRPKGHMLLDSRFLMLELLCFEGPLSHAAHACIGLGALANPMQLQSVPCLCILKTFMQALSSAKHRAYHDTPANPADPTLTL